MIKSILFMTAIMVSLPFSIYADPSSNEMSISQLTQTLNLTPQQTAGLKALRLKMQAQKVPFNTELKDVNNQILALSKNDPLDERKLDDLLYRKHQILGQLDKNGIMSQREMYLMLNPEQQSTFEKLFWKKEP